MHINFYLTEEEQEQIDRLCEQMEMEPEELARLMVVTGLSWAEDRMEGGLPSATVLLMFHSLLGVSKPTESQFN